MHVHGMSTVSSLLGQLSQAIQQQVITPLQASSSTAKKPPTLDDIPQLVEQMLNSKKGIERAAATKRIYELCDVGHKHNRVPMVCSGKYNVLSPLAKCLSRDEENGDVCHLACLALNNLSIPPENKTVMLLGPASQDIIGGLCKILAHDNAQTESSYKYLACICLMNLSFLEDLTINLLQYSPPNIENAAAAAAAAAANGNGKSTSSSLTPSILDNPDSLLRVLEKFLANNSSSSSSLHNITAAAVIPKSDGCSPNSTESSSSRNVRWACGLIKNLAKNEENAALIGQTDIPKGLVENIRRSTTTTTTTGCPSSSCWTYNSLEFFGLFAILNLALWPVSSREALIHAGALEVLTPIMAEGDSDSLQGLISTMVCAFLDAKWTAFPKGGIPAAKSVAELITNTVEKKGKDGQYDYGFFKLSTAIKAYRDLARVAAKADNDDNNDEKSYSKTKVLAFPSAVALILQIISDMVISSMDAVDAKKGTGSISKKYSTPDDAMKSAEYAVEALEAMLPAILQVANDKSSVQISKTAASEISQMLLTFANVASTKTASIQAATKIKQETSSGSSSLPRPILEMSHNLWTHYCKREGQFFKTF